MVSVRLEYMAMVLACSCSTLEAQIFESDPYIWGIRPLSHNYAYHNNFNAPPQNKIYKNQT